MANTLPLNQTFCDIREVNCCLLEYPCPQCQEASGRYTTANRTAIDVSLDHPVLVSVRISVHYCRRCQRYFRARPDFLRPDAVYSNRVVDKAMQSVFEDGMALRRVPERLARDFWVRPSEGIIRSWCGTYGAAFDFCVDYQAKVISEFSGILCVDEVYQDKMALLLAVDPVGTHGDRLVGYQLIHGSVDAVDVKGFLASLKLAGVEPDQVITDGSKLYPTVLRQIWPTAAHQLCLFHEARRVNQAAMKSIQALLKHLPTIPPTPSLFTGGQLKDHPPSADPQDAANQRWYWRQAQRRTQIAEVHQLDKQGLSQRAIAQRTGRNRRTVKQWLEQEIPPLPADLPEQLSELAPLPAPQQRREQKQRRLHRVHELAAQGFSHAAIAREVGVHRLTVKSWLRFEPEPIDPVASSCRDPDPEPICPPAGWANWHEVVRVRQDLKAYRFLLMRHPRNLDEEEQRRIDALLASPIGPELQVIRCFLTDWYAIWHDETGQRRPLDQAREQYERWHHNVAYTAVPQLRRIQEETTTEKFVHISQFLHDSQWEATNNGAERTARQFRHRQAPHFNLRQEKTIANSIQIAAMLHMAASASPNAPRLHTCQRGRKNTHSASQTGTVNQGLCGATDG